MIGKMLVSMPAMHFAEGGRATSSSSSPSSSRGGGQAPIKIIAVNDWKAALREARKDSDHQTFIIDTVKGAAHQIGIAPINA
jgi:hypothetical protein